MRHINFNKSRHCGTIKIKLSIIFSLSLSLPIKSHLFKSTFLIAQAPPHDQVAPNILSLIPSENCSDGILLQGSVLLEYFHHVPVFTCSAKQAYYTALYKARLFTFNNLEYVAQKVTTFQSFTRQTFPSIVVQYPCYLRRPWNYDNPSLSRGRQ